MMAQRRRSEPVDYHEQGCCCICCIGLGIFGFVALVVHQAAMWHLGQKQASYRRWVMPPLRSRLFGSSCKVWAHDRTEDVLSFELRIAPKCSAFGCDSQEWLGLCSWQRATCTRRQRLEQLKHNITSHECWQELPDINLKEIPQEHEYIRSKCAYRYATLREAKRACEANPRCGGITRDGGQHCKPGSADEFGAGAVDLGPVCLTNSVLAVYGADADDVWHVGGKNPKKPTLIDYGGGHHYTVQRRHAPWPPDASWSDALYLTWFTCEGNINHFLGETVGAIWALLQRHSNATWQPALPQVAITGVRNEFWPMVPPYDMNCKGTRWASLLALLPLQKELIFVPEEIPTRFGAARFQSWNRLLRGYMLDSGASRTIVNVPPSCFRHTYQQVPALHGAASNPQSFYRELARLGGCSPSQAASTRVDIILLRRHGSRRIVNGEHVVQALRAMHGVDSVEAVDLASYTPLEQMRRVCSARLLVGVHGSGMEWGHFLNGARVSSAAGPLASSMEIRWERWPCYYTPMMQNVGMSSDCQEHKRARRKPSPKDDDVVVDVPRLISGTRRLLQRMTGLPRDWRARFG